MSEPKGGFIDLEALAKALDESLKSEQGLSRLKSLIRNLLIRDDVDVVDEDNDLVTAIVYRLDATEGDAALRALATSYFRLLNNGIPRAEILLLVPFVEARHRFAELLAKFAQGIVTRESLASYVGSQRLSPEVKRALGRLSDAELAQLRTALTAEDYAATFSLLFPI